MDSKKYFSSNSIASFGLPTNLCWQEVDDEVSRPESLRENDQVLFFDDDHVVRDEDRQSYVLPIETVCPSLDLDERDYVYLGSLVGSHLWAARMQESVKKTKPELTRVRIRDALTSADDKTCQLICRGRHLLQWHRASRYSGCCGTPTKLSGKEIAKVCQSCDTVTYPTISPVVMVSVESQGKILLARSPHFAEGMYSTLAGFVDAGESCEAAIHREVKEEVGIQVEDITYLGSQAWPFPGSIILGFRATYSSGDICMDPKEIEDAGWYDVNELPVLPHSCSIARHLIDDYISRTKTPESHS